MTLNPTPTTLSRVHPPGGTELATTEASLTISMCGRNSQRLKHPLIISSRRANSTEMSLKILFQLKIFYRYDRFKENFNKIVFDSLGNYIYTKPDP